MGVVSAVLRRMLLPTFFQAGFTFERSGSLEGWLSRDPYTDEWILWSERTKQMYRRTGQGEWKPSPEKRDACLKLGRVYAEMKGF